MYIWIGCKLPEEFEESLRQACLAHREGLETDISGFSLPQHISLKISFDAGARYEEVLNSIEALLRRESLFSVHPSAIEQAGSILWVSFQENAILRRLHNRLDRDLREHFGIGQHLFDKAFRFHSTVCLGSEESLRVLRERLTNFPLHHALAVDTFLLGLSPTGKSGSYRVVREIKV